MNDFFDLIIVGAGVSGCFCAINKNKHTKTLIIDANKTILKKFMMTGKGKSNITNTQPIEIFLKNIIDSNKFLYPSLTKYNSNQILALLDHWNIKYYVKEPHRIHLQDSNEVFKQKVYQTLLEKNVELKLDCLLTSVNKVNDLFILTTNQGLFKCKYLVVATGGLSFNKIPFKHSGYEISKSFNHSIKPFYPIGVGLHIDKNPFIKLQGISIENVKVSVYWDGKFKYEECGPLMFTHYGIGGPVVRRVSGYVSKYLLNHQSCMIKITFIDKSLLEEILNEQQYLTSLYKYLNKGFLKIVLANFNLNEGLKNMQKELKNEIINRLCDVEFTIFKSEPIEVSTNTGGGIDLKHINPNTFESTIVENLYFIGEVLDINPRTNGFNITVCYSSALSCINAINNKMQKNLKT